MRVLVDTNVLISGAILKSPVVELVFRGVLDSDEHVLLIAEYAIDEACRITTRKWPERRGVLDTFLVDVAYEAIARPAPDADVGELSIRDPKDLPILQAAVAGRADVIVTGDKDFADADTGGIPVFTPAGFIAAVL